MCSTNQINSLLGKQPRIRTSPNGSATFQVIVVAEATKEDEPTATEEAGGWSAAMQATISNID